MTFTGVCLSFAHTDALDEEVSGGQHNRYTEIGVLTANIFVSLDRSLTSLHRKSNSSSEAVKLVLIGIP